MDVWDDMLMKHPARSNIPTSHMIESLRERKPCGSDCNFGCSATQTAKLGVCGLAHCAAVRLKDLEKYIEHLEK